jgi:hypothetical protein
MKIIEMTTERVCAGIYGMVARSYMTDKEIQDVVSFVHERLKFANDTRRELDILVRKARNFADAVHEVLGELENSIHSNVEITDEDLKNQVSLCMMYSIAVRILDDANRKKLTKMGQ